MVQLKILSGKMAGHECVARRLPFQVGRGTGAGLRLEDPGVWDQHLIIKLVEGSQLQIETQQGAVASVNGEAFEKRALRNGDLIQVGAVQLRFGFCATRQKSLLGRELLVWAGLAGISLGQVALIYWLLR